MTIAASDQTAEQVQHLNPIASPRQTVMGYAHDVAFLDTWHSFALASVETIDRLLHAYIEAFYPIYPLFHWPSFHERVRNRDFFTDRGLFASVMGACALVQAQELTTVGHVFSALPGSSSGRKTEIHFLAASDAIPRDLSSAHSLHYLRASGLLALAALHSGQTTAMHEYLGRFWTLSSAYGFADESQWPQDITLVEREERRRLFWSIYSLDMLAVTVYGKTTSVEDANAHVKYPQELDDPLITDHSYVFSAEPSWFKGWTFVVDLTRALAKNVVHHRRRNHSVYSGGLSCLREHTSILPNSDGLVVNAMACYHQMPPQFKRDASRATTADFEATLIDIQAIRIRVSVQLLCASACLGHNGPDIDAKFDCAEELLSLIQGVDNQLPRVAMTPLAHYMVAIVQEFTNNVEPLTTASLRQRMRSVLERMEVLVSGSETLRRHVTELLRGQQSSIQRLNVASHE